jgi:hypothetical protein
VVRTDPAAGAPLPAQVTLAVSASPSAVFLSELESASGFCSSTSATTGGKRFDHSLVCDTSESTVFGLAGLVDGLVATVGVSDEAETGSTARLEVVVDGRVAATIDVRFGETKPLEVSLAGAQLLELRVTGADDGQIVLGDARFIGSPTNIDQLSRPAP